MTYPDKIARAAFMSNNYVVPRNNLMFPLGISKNPLARDVDIDLLKFVKSDIAVFLNSNPNLKAMESQRYAKDYLKQLSSFSARQGVLSRIAVRSQDYKYIYRLDKRRFASVFAYLFAKN